MEESAPDELHPHVAKLVTYLPHLSDVVRERRLIDKLEQFKKDDAERIAKLGLAQRVYHRVVKRKFLEMMDDDNNVPPRVKERLPLFWSRVVSFMAKLAFVLIVAILTWKNYQSDQQTQYVSLNAAVNNESSPNYDPNSGYRSCETVPNAITGHYKLDSNGYWSGMTQFVPGLGKLQLSLNSFEKNDQTYKEYMAFLNSSISTQVSKNAASRSTAINLLYSMAYTLAVKDNSTGTTDIIAFGGDPSFIFNRFSKNAVLGSAAMTCYSVPSIAFERASGNFEVKYTMGSPTFDSLPQSGSGFLSDSPSDKTGCCTKANTPYVFDKDTSCIVAPNNVGYSTMTDATGLSFKYNIWSVVVALAVNLKILKFSNLDKVYTNIQSSAKGCHSLNVACMGKDAVTNGVCNRGETLTYSSATKACSFMSQATNGKRWFIESKMLSKFPGMDPIYCLTEEIGATKTVGCFVRIGTSFALPFANHMGVSIYGGQYDTYNDFYNWKYWCDCSAPDMSTISSSTLKAFYLSNVHNSRKELQGSFWDQTYGKSDPYCSKFDLIHGLIMMKGDKQDAVLKHFVNNVMEKYTADQINAMASISGFTAIKTGGSAGVQSSSFWTMSSTQGKLITQDEYLTALTLPNNPPQIGWYVSIDGDSSGQEFGNGLFIRSMKYFSDGSATKFMFKLSGAVKFTTSLTITSVKLVASPIPIGNTQVGDFKKAMGTVDAVNFNIYLTKNGSPNVVVSNIDNLAAGDVLGVKCSCTKDVSITATIGGGTTNELTYTGSKLSTIAVGNSISSDPISLLEAFISQVDSATNKLTLNKGFSCVSSCSSVEFTVTTTCDKSLALGTTVRNILSIETYTVGGNSCTGKQITSPNLDLDKVKVGSFASGTGIASDSYVTAIDSSSKSVTLNKAVTPPCSSVTFTTKELELSSPLSFGSTNEVLSCSASYATNAFTWCSDPSNNDAGSDCVVLAMQTFDTFDQRLNEEGSVPQTSMSCNDDFSMSASAWAVATSTPPAPLYQSYYKCLNTQLSSFSVGFGVASGIAGTLTPLAVIFFVFTATKIAIPALKSMHSGASRLSGKYSIPKSAVVAINGDEIVEVEADNLGDTDGDGNIDETELDGFGRIKHG